MLPCHGFYSLNPRLQQQQQQQFASPDRPAFAIILLSFSSALAFMLPFHGFYPLITRLQQQQHNNNFLRLITLLSLSSCSRYVGPFTNFIQLLLNHNNNSNNNRPSPYRPAFAIFLLLLLSAFAFMSSYHGFYTFISRQQQQQMFIALSPCSRYRPTFNVGAFIDFIQLLPDNNNNNNIHHLIVLLSLSSCSRYRFRIDFIQSLPCHGFYSLNPRLQQQQQQ